MFRRNGSPRIEPLSRIRTDRQTQLQSKAGHGKKKKKKQTSCAIRLWRTDALRARNGTLQCRAGPDRHGCHGINDAMASAWAPAAGHIVGSPTCLAATSQPNPLVTLISIGVTPQSSPDTFLTQSVCLSVSAAAPRLERRIPSAVARHIHRQGSTCKVLRVSSCAQGWGRGHDGDTLVSERNVFVSLLHAVSILLHPPTWRC